MDRLARLFATVALGAAVAAGPAQATSSLSFEGGGYWLDLEVGDDAAPSIAAVRFHAPGDAQGVVLPANRLQVLRFDAAAQRLELHYAGGDGVAAFTLSVDHADAVLQAGATRVAAPFDWTH